MIKSIFIALCFSLCITKFAYASSDKIQVTVASPNIYPFSYLNDKNEVVGFLANCLKNNTEPKYNYNIIVLPWARAIQEIKRARVDAIMPANFTKQRTQFLSYPNKPIVEFLSDVLVTKASVKFTSFENAKENNKIIGKVRSKALAKDVKNIIDAAKLEILNVKDPVTALKMILQNRIDYFIGDPQIIKHITQQENMLNKFSFIQLSDKTSHSFLAFSKPFAKKHNINNLMNEIHCGNLLFD